MAFEKIDIPSPRDSFVREIEGRIGRARRLTPAGSSRVLQWIGPEP